MNGRVVPTTQLSVRNHGATEPFECRLMSCCFIYPEFLTVYIAIYQIKHIKLLRGFAAIVDLPYADVSPQKCFGWRK